MNLSKESPSIGRNLRKKLGRTAVGMTLLGGVAVIATACATDKKEIPNLSNAPFYSVAALKEDDGRKLCAGLDNHFIQTTLGIDDNQRIQTKGIVTMRNPRYLGNISLEDPNENRFPESKIGKTAIEVNSTDIRVVKALAANVGKQVTVEGRVVFYNVNPTSNDCWLQDAVILETASNVPTVGATIPENMTLREKAAARGEEIQKIRSMFEGHNVISPTQSSMDSFWVALPTLSQSEYDSAIKEYAIRKEIGARYDINVNNGNGSRIRMISLSSTVLSGSSVTSESIMIIQDPKPDLRKVPYGLKEELVDIFGNMQNIRIAQMSTSKDFVPYVFDYRGYANDLDPGTLRIDARIVDDGRTEILEQKYTKAK